MSKPTTVIDPLYNAKLLTNLDCGNFQLLNLDTSNLVGLGGSGNDTGTTTAILKGDGNHGFADAIGGTDYATVASLASKEDQTAHNADITTLTTSIGTINTDIASINTSLSSKASTTALTDGLALKADDADLTAYITSNDSALSALTTEVGNKASSASVSAGLATKEPLLPTTANDRYILARRNSSGTDAWFFVDPVTLGTTSQSFTDGVENSSTTFTSATANFVVGDVGKTITGDNIPAATTIASRTNSTTIVLSQAATATGGSKNFTILNRLEVGGTGTVTSVAATNNITELFSATVTNATSSATITFDPSVTVGANRFYGNFTGFAGTASFGTASAARASLGGTTAGQALFQVTNPSAISFPQFTAINGVITRTPAQVLGDIGAESALTFSTPLLRSVSPPNVISIQVATTLQSGYLSNSDWTVFNGKLAPSRIITTTAPLKIDGTASANLTADRTLSMAAAASAVNGSGQVDGYLKGADFYNFLNKPPNGRTLGTLGPLAIGGVVGASLDLSADRTFSIAKATTLADGYVSKEDYAAFASGSPKTITLGVTSGTTTIASLSPPITRVVLTQAITTPGLAITLPTALNYNFGGGFPFLEIVDTVQGGAFAAFGITLFAASGESIDNASSVPIPRGSGYVRLNSNGLTRWTTTAFYAKSISNPNNPAGLATFSGASLTAARSINVPDANSTFVVPTSLSGIAGVVLDVNTDGSVSKGELKPVNLVPNVYSAGQSGFPIIGPVPVTNNGLIDTVAIFGNVTGALTIQLPDVSGYKRGQELSVIDYSGTVNGSDHIVTVTSTNGTDTFNLLNTSIAFDEKNGRRVFTADAPGFNNWAVPSTKTTLNKPFTALTANSGTFTLQVDSSAAGAQNAQLTLASGANTLAVSAPFDGMKIELVVIQPSGGAPGTLALPSVSMVSGNGLGLVGLTPTNPAAGAVDRLRGTYDAAIPAYLWEAPILNHTSAALPAAPTGLSISTITSSSLKLDWANTATNETGVEVHRSTDVFATNDVTVAVAAVDSITYTDTGLAASTSYSYKVATRNSAGRSAFSNVSTQSTSSACSTLADSFGTGVVTGSFVSIATGNGTKFISSGGYVPTATNTSPCRITAAIYMNGNPIGDLTAYIYANDGVSGIPGTQLYASSVVTRASITNALETDAIGTPLQFTFSGVSLSTSSTYYIVVGCSQVAASNAAANCYRWVGNGNQLAAFATYKSSTGGNASFTALGGNNKSFFKTYK